MQAWLIVHFQYHHEPLQKENICLAVSGKAPPASREKAKGGRKTRKRAFARGQGRRERGQEKGERGQEKGEQGRKKANGGRKRANEGRKKGKEDRKNAKEDRKNAIEGRKTRKRAFVRDGSTLNVYKMGLAGAR